MINPYQCIYNLPKKIINEVSCSHMFNCMETYFIGDRVIHFNKKKRVTYLLFFLKTFQSYKIINFSVKAMRPGH